MTQDYKDTLLRYLTGNLNEQTGDNTPQFEEEKTISNTLGSYISTNAGSNYKIIDVIQGLNSNYSVIYGNKNNNKGFMVIIDENYEPIQYIDSYSSGTDFGEFKILNVAEDGNLYGIDVTSVPRFIMLNNVILKTPNQSEFIVRLRQSYNLPSPLSTALNYFGITKAVGQGKYLIGYIVKSGSYDNPRATELTINVGAENEWVTYEPSSTVQRNFVGCSLWASWDNSTIDFRLDGYNTHYVQVEPGQPEVLRAFYEKWKSSDNNKITGSNYMIDGIDGIANGYYSINITTVNKYLTYIGAYDGGEYGDSEKITIYSNSDRGDFNYREEIATFQPGPTVGIATINRRIEFKVLNGNAYFIAKALDGSLNLHLYTGFMVTTVKTISGYTIEYGILYNTEILPTTQNSDDFLFYISNIYNLYNYNILGMDFNNQTGIGKSYLIQQIYNPNNYNGISYEDVNALTPHSGIVYDSNDLIVFARNIYNKSVYNNTTLSVIQIPNTMCNNMILATQNLLGETNKILISNGEIVEKNIYETLYFNFYNDIVIQNQNTEEHITNMTGSARLNNSVSLNKDYNNAQGTKYRINYQDNTSIVKNLVWYKIQNYYQTKIVVYVGKLINTIEIISNDENTIYQTIDCSTLEINKIYNIFQDVHIDIKQSQQQIYYNNDEIYYNNNKIYY